MRPRALIRVLLAAGLTGLLAACSVLSLGYNNADTLIQWRAGKYFGFEGAQKAEFERRVRHFLAWHRRTALPQYALLANQMGDRIARGLTQDDLIWGYDAFRNQLRQSVQAGSEQMGDLLDALSPAQVDRFRSRLAEENRERAKEYGLHASVEVRREKRTKRNVERLEDWVGPLTEAQFRRVEAYSDKAPLDGQWRDRDRRRLQHELLAMIGNGNARGMLATWAVTWEQNREPAYADALNANLQEYFRMMLDLDGTLSAAQRDKAVRRMREFAGEFTALAAVADAAR